jgi:hypothetical protein
MTMTRLLLCTATILALTASAMAQREITSSTYFGVPVTLNYNYGTETYRDAGGRRPSGIQPLRSPPST